MKWIARRRAGSETGLPSKRLLAPRSRRSLLAWISNKVLVNFGLYQLHNPWDRRCHTTEQKESEWKLNTHTHTHKTFLPVAAYLCKFFFKCKKKNRLQISQWTTNPECSQLMEILIPNNAWPTAVSLKKVTSSIASIVNFLMCLPRTALILNSHKK